MEKAGILRLTELQGNSVLSADMLFEHYVLFPPTAYTQCFIFCLSNKPKKWYPKYLLVTEIISI